ncbi:MAG: ZIP family metal transporter [Reyranellaceae bacterium]
MPVWLEAAFWGLLSGSALVIGAAIGYFARLSDALVAAIMAFGAGVLLSALSFELMLESAARGGLAPAVGGFLLGALLYAGANALLARHGARHRKRSRQPEQADAGALAQSGTAIALGALLDGLPESAALGASMLDGHEIGIVLVVALFLSNLPEGLSSAAGMKRRGHGKAYVFGVWGGIAILSALAAAAGAGLLGHLSAEAVSVTIAVAAGAILVMLIDTMLPEAFAEMRSFTAPLAVAGFVLAFVLGRLT